MKMKLVVFVVCAFAASGAFAKNVALKFENGSCFCIDRENGCANALSPPACSEIKDGDKCPAKCTDKLAPSPAKDGAAAAKDVVAPAKDASAAKGTTTQPAAATATPAAGTDAGKGAPKK